MSVWVVATTAGALGFAEAIPDPKGLGMDFAFTAAFIAIARSLFRGRADLAPWAVSLAVVVLVGSRPAGSPAPWALVLGGLSGAAAAGTLRDRLNAWVMDLLPLGAGHLRDPASPGRCWGGAFRTTAPGRARMRALPGCLIVALVAVGLGTPADFANGPQGSRRGSPRWRRAACRSPWRRASPRCGVCAIFSDSAPSRLGELRSLEYRRDWA